MGSLRRCPVVAVVVVVVVVVGEATGSADRRRVLPPPSTRFEPAAGRWEWALNRPAHGAAADWQRRGRLSPVRVRLRRRRRRRRRGRGRLGRWAHARRACPRFYGRRHPAQVHHRPLIAGGSAPDGDKVLSGRCLSLGLLGL